ncbi:uncharacterized protein H6S33_002293 [Morchella sextelata]|uniref:uncharacterized protein n=1 Tax=Morchella sextelata TaxID=1174677 RepID=UPI001D04B6AA|nr:uncharacterized protein H6S33_002293 [Morchella sextelata]KAH0608241.1 hypothetical protein H6S33_002293 [Morchella sextelata]
MRVSIPDKSLCSSSSRVVDTTRRELTFLNRAIIAYTQHHELGVFFIHVQYITPRGSINIYSTTVAESFDGMASNFDTRLKNTKVIIIPSAINPPIQGPATRPIGTPYTSIGSPPTIIGPDVDVIVHVTVDGSSVGVIVMIITVSKVDVIEADVSHVNQEVYPD